MSEWTFSFDELVEVNFDAPGVPGRKGDPGEGLPAGGTTGQFARKASATDYDTEWVDVNAATVGADSAGSAAAAQAAAIAAAQSYTDGVSAADRVYVDNEIAGLAPVASSGAYSDLTGRPTLGTAAAQNTTAFATAAQGAKADTAIQDDDLGTSAYLDVPATGNALTTQVVKGNDSRLTNARPPTAHTHTKSDISDFSDGDYATAAQGALADSASQPGHAHTKSDISDFSDGDYATAAQGAKADTASQPGHTHTEAEITDLGSYPDATGQPATKMAQTDGADGWTFVDPPSGGSGFAPDPSAQPDNKWLTTESGEYVFTDAPAGGSNVGAWSDATSYEIGDVVVHNNQWWKATAANINEQPSENTPQPIFVSASSPTSVAGTSLAVAAPERQVGDLLVCYVQGYFSDLQLLTVAGWTKDAISDEDRAVFWRIADGTSADDVSATVAQADRCKAQIAVFRAPSGWDTPAAASWTGEGANATTPAGTTFIQPGIALSFHSSIGWPLGTSVCTDDAGSTQIGIWDNPHENAGQWRYTEVAAGETPGSPVYDLTDSSAVKQRAGALQVEATPGSGSWAKLTDAWVSIPTFTATHGVGVGTLRWYNDTGSSIIIAGARATLSADAVDAATVVDVNVDDVSALDAPISIAVGTRTTKVTDEIVVPVDSYLTMDVDSVGTPGAGETLAVQFYT